MATGHTSLSRRSKLSGLIRSPFRFSSVTPDDNDWYIPYNGPIEPPRHSVHAVSGIPAFEYSTPPRRETSPVASSAHRDSRMIGHLRDLSPKRAHKAGKGARQTVISLDTGGIGESPATVLDEQNSRRPSATNLFSSSSHTHKDRSPPPAAVPYVVNTPSPTLTTTAAARHPFNPHGFDNYTFPSTATATTKPTSSKASTSASPLITTTPTPTFPSSHSNIERHPYSAKTFSRGEQIWPGISVNTAPTTTTSRSRAATILSNGTVTSTSDRSTATMHLTSERNLSEWGQHQQHSETVRHRTESRHGRVEQHFTGSSGSTSATSMSPRDRDHHSFPQHHTLSKSRSTPQSLSASHYNYLNTTTPAYSMQTHPYALSPIPSSLAPGSPSGTPLGFNGKPPIPRKSPGVLQRLRATASAPNLLNATKHATTQQAVSHSHSHIQDSSYPREHKRSHVPPRIDVTPPAMVVHSSMAHELPVTLAPASSVQAMAYPRPRFISAVVPPEDPIPGSPYPLSRPQLPEFDDTDRNILAQCLPLPVPNSYRERMTEVREGKGSTPPGAGPEEGPSNDAASFKSKDVEKTLILRRGGPHEHEDDDDSEDEADEEEMRAERLRRRERDDALAQAVRDNELLTAERERWEKHAQRSLGNRQSRSLSIRGKQLGVRRSVSHSALGLDASAVAGSATADAAGGRAPNGRHRAMTMGNGDGKSMSSTRTRKMSSKGASRPPPASSARSRSTTLDSVAGPGASVSSLRYLASAAFGHTGHSAKLSVDSASGSGGRTSFLATSSPATHADAATTGVVGAASGGSVSASRRSATSGSRSGSVSGSHSRGSSADTRHIAVATVVRLSQEPPPPPQQQQQQQDYDADVMDIRDNEDNSVRLAVEQRIGLALSPSPELVARSRSNTVLSGASSGGMQHPYASPSVISMSLSSRAGPHPTTASPTNTVPFKDDVSARHRLPPQVVHAHKRSLSAGNSGSSVLPGAAAALTTSTQPARAAKMSAPPTSDMPDHPFMASSEMPNRPTSGQVESSFQEALIASTTSSEWPPSLSAELRDGDPDPFRRNPVAVAPTTPPRTPPRGTTSRSNGAVAASPSTTPRTHRRKFFALSSSGSERPSPAPVATSTPLKRRSRSMSDIKTQILGLSSSSPPDRTSLRPVSPAFTFGTPDSPQQTSQARVTRPSLENHASYPSGGISPPTESSVASIVNPEFLLHEGRDDLEEFRDLFYRPHMTYSTESSPRESMRVDAGLDSSSMGLGLGLGGGGRPMSGTSSLWNSLTVPSEHFEVETGNASRLSRPFEHQPSVHRGSPDTRAGRSSIVPDNGKLVTHIATLVRVSACLLTLKTESVRLRSIDTSTPSIFPGAQRHSSTPQIEEEPSSGSEQSRSGIARSPPEGYDPDNSNSIEPVAGAIPRAIERDLSNSPGQSFLAADGSLLRPGSHDNSSSAEEWNRFSHATEGSRMSNIIRGFPTPPDATPPVASVLGAYFADDAPPASPGHIPNIHTPEPDTELERQS
jgi:hypothetical protein